MATIRRRKTKDGEKRYDVEIRRRGVKPIRKTFHRLGAARKWSEEIESGIISNTLTSRIEASRHLLSEACLLYLEDADLARQDERLSHLEWWVDHLGDVTLDQVTTASILDARAELLTDRTSSTANRYVSALSAVLRACVEWGWVDVNPCKKFKRLKEPKGRLRFLSDDERRELLKACRQSDDPRLYAIVLFAITTGARQGELMSLRWRDVRLSADPPEATIEDTKNDDRRAVFFLGPAGDVLAEMSNVRHFSGYLFGTDRTRRDQKHPPQFPFVHWWKAVEDAELEDLRFHDLRHTAASYMAQSGATLNDIAAMLGHRTLSMVMRYAHLTKQGQVDAQRRMVDRFLS